MPSRAVTAGVRGSMTGLVDPLQGQGRGQVQGTVKGEVWVIKVRGACMSWTSRGIVRTVSVHLYQICGDQEKSILQKAQWGEVKVTSGEVTIAKRSLRLGPFEAWHGTWAASTILCSRSRMMRTIWTGDSYTQLPDRHILRTPERLLVPLPPIHWWHGILCITPRAYPPISQEQLIPNLHQRCPHAITAEADE